MMIQGETMASPTLVPMPRINQVSGIVVNAAMRVHSLLGPGLLESAYQACLAQELRKRGLRVDTQVGLPVVYEGEPAAQREERRTAHQFLRRPLEGWH